MSKRATRLAAAAAVFLISYVLLCSVALAGVYEVRACDAADGVNNSWAAHTNAPWMTAYTQCPTGGDQNAGMVARSTMPAQATGTSQGVVAQMVFTAPPGAAVVGLRASYRFSRTDATWEAALSNGQQVLRGCPAGGGSGCEIAQSEDFAIPPSGAIYIDSFCAFGSCPFGAGSGASARLYSAIVRVSDDSAPGVGSPSGSLWSDGWKRGSQDVAFDASDNVGIRETNIYLDGQPVRQAAKPCDYTQTAPCPQGGATFAIDTRTAGDGAHTLALEAVDTAGNGARISRKVLLDNTAPGPPQNLTLDGGDGWRSSNAFTLRWQNPADGGAPIAGAGYQLCPAAGGSCSQGRRDASGASSLDGLKVPAAGDYVLRVWLRDAAGNEDSHNAGPAVQLRFDDEAPNAAFAAIDPADPTRVTVRAGDRVSGLAGGVVEIKAHRSQAWRPLATRVDGQNLVATLNDEHLRNGLHDLRARGRSGGQRALDHRTQRWRGGDGHAPYPGPHSATGGCRPSRCAPGEAVRACARA
jgi:hypothetical protein